MTVRRTGTTATASKAAPVRKSATERKATTARPATKAAKAAPVKGAAAKSTPARKAASEATPAVPVAATTLTATLEFVKETPYRVRYETPKGADVFAMAYLPRADVESADGEYLATITVTVTL